MNNSVITHSAQETRTLGNKLVETLKPGGLITFEGDLGAGKTTLIQGILESFGAERPFVSPTFTLMKEYVLASPSATGVRRIYHADAYRVGAEDFAKIGFEEWCADPEAIVLLEWPERVAELLPEKRVIVTIKSLSESEREVVVKKSEV